MKIVSTVLFLLQLEVSYASREDLIAIVVTLPSTSLVDRFQAVLEVMNRNGLERRRKNVSDARVSLDTIFPSSVNEECLQNMGTRDSMQNRQMLSAEVDHRHWLAVVALDVATEAEFAGVVHRHLDQRDTCASKEEGSGSHAVDGGKEVVAFASELLQTAEQSRGGQLYVVEVG